MSSRTRIRALNIFLYRIYAFFRRDVVNVSSYKLNFIFEIISMFIWALTMGTLGLITQSAQAPYLQVYGNINAATFLLIGMMCNFFLQQSQGMPQWVANPGAMERILLTPCSIPTFILGTMTWDYFWNGMNIVIFVFMGTLLFGMNLATVNWATFIVVLLLGVMAMWGLGIIAAGIQLVTKQWNPITWFLMTFSSLVSGVYFSPEALLIIDKSGLLYAIAWCLPQTYVFHMARLSFVGKTLLDMLPILARLSVLAGIFFGMGWLTFRFCMRRCQLEGSLGWV
jgi:ABC-type polysaccharide/polyol phosphate export permease